METYPNLQDAASYGNLLLAHANAKRGKSHYKAVREFERNKDELLKKLSESLLSGTYRTSPYKNKIIHDSGKERLISKLPYYPDRIAHWALMLQLEPAFVERFSNRSHAAIKDHGTHSALYQTRFALLHNPVETTYCLKIDVKKYFHHIDHEILKRKLRALTPDISILERMDEIIDSFPNGIPIGNYTSQYLANYYLTALDNVLTSRGILHIRYMDDIVIFGAEKEYLWGILGDIREYLEGELKVSLKGNYQVFPTAVRGVDYVGYRIFPNRVLLRKSTFKRMRRKLARVRKHLEAGYFTQSDMSCIASYAGQIKYCTPDVRKGLYERYFSGLLKLISGNTQFKTKIVRAFNYGS